MSKDPPVASLAPNAGLLGQDTKDAALVLQWANYASKQILGLDTLVSVMMAGVASYNKSVR